MGFADPRRKKERNKNKTNKKEDKGGDGKKEGN